MARRRQRRLDEAKKDMERKLQVIKEKQMQRRRRSLNSRLVSHHRQARLMHLSLCQWGKGEPYLPPLPHPPPHPLSLVVSVLSQMTDPIDVRLDTVWTWNCLEMTSDKYVRHGRIVQFLSAPAQWEKWGDLLFWLDPQDEPAWSEVAVKLQVGWAGHIML